MNFIRLIPVLFSTVLMSAHFSRAQNNGLALVCLLLPLLLLIRKRWVADIFQILLITGAIIWFESMFGYIQLRQETGRPWVRLAIILGAVAVFTGLSALVFRKKKLRMRYHQSETSDIPGVAAFFLTSILLAVVQIKVDVQMLILDRFFPTFGWLEIFLLAIYARWITVNMLDPTKSARWRLRIWLIFSIVFFGQFILGLLISDTFLMTGNLHLPVPAIIVAGPLFRGHGFFMPILFISTIMLVGPAWCSHLCYIGSWDNATAVSRKRPRELPAWRQPLRMTILLVTIATALLLRTFGVSTGIATMLGILFGLVGVGFMIFWSKKTGMMTHCIMYCPIGLLANWLGKLSPFRIRISDGCTECLACNMVCRYQALTLENIQARKAGSSCTLCGDCVGSCHSKQIKYRFMNLESNKARILFIVLIVSIHAVFLGVARI